MFLLIAYIYIYIWVVSGPQRSPNVVLQEYAFSMFVWLGKRRISRALDVTGFFFHICIGIPSLDHHKLI